MEQKEKKYPFRITESYSPGLNSLKRIYTQHPKFNGNVRLVYELLFDLWNEKYGYAYPNIWQLSKETGLGESTVERCLTILVDLDLLERRPSPVAQNNVYIVKPPLTTMEAFLEKFPEVREYMQQRIEAIDERERKSKVRLSRTRKKAAVDNDKPLESLGHEDDTTKPPEVTKISDDLAELSKWL